MPGHLGAVSLKKSHDIVILSVCNIVYSKVSEKLFEVALSVPKTACCLFCTENMVQAMVMSLFCNFEVHLSKL